ncbi:MAG TPA: LemA family protein [Candidatus Eisenbacteria bacterium]|jgi:LemA protein|nr:LemA family protein [Candidatus Eisenbacteria bacterium]
METGLIILGIAAFMLLVGISTVIGLRNGIVSSKNRVKRAWADVITYQRKKLNVIPALEQGLKDHQAYEQGTLEKVTALRNAVTALSADSVNVGQLQQADQLSKSLLSGLRVTAEAYPVLKTSELYAGWMRELSEAEENIAAAIVIFNGTVQGFNDRLQEFPGNVVNSWFNHERPLETFSDTAAQAGIEYRPTFTQ